MTSFIDDNGNELEYDGKDFAVSKQTISFIDFKIRGDFSVNFKLKNTAHNRMVLGFLGPNQINAALIPVVFSLVRNGNKILRGLVYIYESDEDEINCSFLSGNSNWFNNFQFKSNEVINPAYSLDWKNSFSSIVTAYDNRNNEHGIVFPIIDYFGFGSRGQAGFGNTIQQSAGNGLGAGPNAVPSLFPCLYVHTLVEEIAKKADIRIAGNILDDAIYKSLIITPNGPELTNPETNERIFMKSNGSLASLNSLITIGSIAPEIKAIEIIKYLCFSFGCIPSFDEESKTLTLTTLKSIDVSDSLDWSEHFISYDFQPDKLKSKYYFKNKYGEELEKYNTSFDPGYGDLLIESGKENGGELTAYQSPFYASTHDINAIMSLPFVGLYEVSLEKSLSYDTVSKPTDVSIRFEGSTNEDAFDNGQRIIVQVIDDNKLYSGFHYGDIGISLGVFTIDVIIQSSLSTIGAKNYFSTTSTGIINIYSLQPSKRQAILRCKPNVNVSDFSIFGEIFYTSTSVRATTASYAWFSKKKGYPNLNDEPGISYGQINSSGFEDIDLSDMHLQPIKKMLSNAPIKAKFKLPETVFSAFDHTKFIFLKTKNISGYFYVHKIENYMNSVTAVTVEMMRVN